VGLLGALGRFGPGSGFPVGRTLTAISMALLLAVPVASLLPDRKLDAFYESLSGMLSPTEDNTGSWRLEQSQHYMKLFPERPLLGWRYEGYDRGEVMENEDFPEKGTIIHSQYIDMLYNYGAVGMTLNLLLLLGTLVVMYRHNRTFTTNQLVLFGFVASGLVYAISYQFPVNFWAFVGLAMWAGLHSKQYAVRQYAVGSGQQQREGAVVNTGGTAKPKLSLN
jgi:O-antigen ligase